ncbi:MAG: fatty acid desaturase family protein [Bacteroidia bacterium]
MYQVRFKNEGSPFYNALKKEVDAYFQSHNLSKVGNWQLYTKGIIVMSLAIYLYVHLFFFTPVWWVALPMAAFFGVVLSLIGMNIMHDGSHGSYTNKKWLNELAGHTFNVLGSTAHFWKLKHNVAHHTYTNIASVDDDIESSFLLRFCPSFPKSWLHPYQHYYAPFLYSLALINWVWATDFRQYFTQKVGNLPFSMKTKDHLIFWLSKLAHIAVFFVIPFLNVPFLMCLAICLTIFTVAGLTISFVFLLAHLVEITEIENAPTGNMKIEREWAAHQVATTADFATKNKVLSWLLGGLNFQVVHHLFPNISHVHYPAIQPIIEKVCKDFNIEYRSFPSMRAAIFSHLRFMKQMGAMP